MARQNSLKSRIKNFGDNFVDSINLPDLEFHIGHVERVFTNSKDVRAYQGKLKDKIPGNPSGVILVRNQKGILPTIGNESLAKPMLRGISDSITRGDLVIYCSIAGQSYYLGPINTTNQVTKTPDPFNALRKSPLNDQRKDQPDGYSINFPPPKTSVNKLQKTYMPEIDYPNNSSAGNPGTTAYHEGSFSDVTLDGRFGNSIRVGSRHSNPILNIHNGRFGTYESLSEGSLISMTSLGSFDNNWLQNQGFLLSSDRRIGIEYSDITEGQYPGYRLNFGNDEVGEPREDLFDYDYSSIETILDNDLGQRDQMILFSDRITFDARKTDFDIFSIP